MTASNLPAAALSTLPIIGVDIGGTKMAAALVSPDGRSVEGLKTCATPHAPLAFLDALSSLVEPLREASGNVVQRVGVATAGMVDNTRGRIIGATGNLPALQDVPAVRAAWEQRSGLMIHLENDANAAAYGEWVAGAGRGCHDLLMITLGTGVGVGFILEGRLIRGAHFSAGEGGHIALSMAHERLCTCGKWDCWETYASGTGLAETARRLLEAAPNAEYSKLVASKPGGIPAVTTHDVVNAWRSGNALALEMMDTWHTHIAVGLGSLINILDPARVVVGGGMAQFVDFKLLTERTMPRTMYPANLPSDIAPLAIVPAELGNQAGLVGAACLARLVP